MYQMLIDNQIFLRNAIKRRKKRHTNMKIVTTLGKVEFAEELPVLAKYPTI